MFEPEGVAAPPPRDEAGVPAQHGADDIDRAIDAFAWTMRAEASERAQP